MRPAKYDIERKKGADTRASLKWPICLFFEKAELPPFMEARGLTPRGKGAGKKGAALVVSNQLRSKRPRRSIDAIHKD